MAQYTNRPKLLPEDVLDRYKYEIADELGLTPRIQSVGWGDMTSRECGLTGGRIGGRMTRVLIRLAEEELASRGSQG
jgi:hypothetical protein